MGREDGIAPAAPDDAVDPARARAGVRTRVLALDLPPEGLRLASGGVLKRVEVAYEAYGRLNAARDNAILICSPLTTDAHAAGYNPDYARPKDRIGWWDAMIGPGKAIDTDKYFVIASNMLGGCKGTTGPSSIDPDTGRPYGSSFPRITVEDIVRVQRLLAEALGVDALEAVVGGSMGGMQALQWTVSYPDKVRKCICIAAAACLSAQALGFEIIGRKVIVNDPGYAGGDFYASGAAPERGLSYARMIGHLTYLSDRSMDQKFGRQRQPGMDPAKFETGFSVEGYLDHQGEEFVRRFDANSYLHITWAMDHFDLVASHGSLAGAFSASRAEYLLVALSSDWLFPPGQTRELARELVKLGKIASMVELDSPHGHDAFLLEVAHLSQVLGAFLERPGGPDAGDAAPSSPAAADGKCFSSQEDFDRLRALIEPGSHIVDIGCGDGALIDALYRSHRATGVGIDIDLANVVGCLRRNVPVLQVDADLGLSLVERDAFDYAVLNRTLQVVKRPQLVLREMLRVARKGIVSFPNFAHMANRLSLLATGAMPVTEALPYSWHDTPNIHLFSLDDFRRLCRREGIRIEELACVGRGGLSRLLLGLGLRNLGAEFVIAKIARA